MTGWYAERTPGRSGRAVIAMTLLALLLVAAVPVAHCWPRWSGDAAGTRRRRARPVRRLGSGGSLAVTLAGMSGMRHVRKLLSGGSLGVFRLDGTQYADAAEPAGRDVPNVLELDRSEYTEVR